MRLLTIRPAQMMVLRDAFLVEWITRKLLANFPRQCEAMGVAELSAFIEAGIQRARGYGFTSDEYLPFVGMELSFGANFIDDPANGWAQREMANRAGSPRERMQRLRRAAIFCLAGQAEAEQRQRDTSRADAESAGGLDG